LLPAPLSAIYEQSNHLYREPSNLDEFQSTWEEYCTEARQQIPKIHIEADGEIVYLGTLSPGCRACKMGTWDCIFLTMRCNLNCEFCYSPQTIPEDYVGSAFGRTPEQITANHARTHITGIGLSGGEPFLEVEKLLEWVAWFKSHSAQTYLWVYTNGLLADEKHVRRLGQLGLDEIRFNLAATGYDHPTVLENLSRAARFIPNVTVEIPAIPRDAHKLLACLIDWETRGVRYLNLHELMYEPGSNAAAMNGPRRPVVTPDGHRTAIHPESRALTMAVMRRVYDQGLRLSVNDCSLQSKLRQLRGRRRNLAPLVQASYERLVGDEVYVSYCAYRDAEDWFFFHPDSLRDMQQRHAGYCFIRLVRTAPLSIQDQGKWIVLEQVESAAAPNQL